MPMNLPDGVQGAVVWTVGVLLRLEVGLEDRLQDQYHRHLHHAVPNRTDLSSILHLFTRELGIVGAGGRPPRFVTIQVPDRRDQRRRTGRRSSAITSGVSRIHQGPCGTA